MQLRARRSATRRHLFHRARSGESTPAAGVEVGTRAAAKTGTRQTRVVMVLPIHGGVVKDSWDVIATYWRLVEAKMASALLASEAIPSRLADEGITGAHPLLAIAVGGVRLLVAPESAQRARMVLQLRGLLPSGGPAPVDPGPLDEEAIEA